MRRSAAFFLFLAATIAIGAARAEPGVYEDKIFMVERPIVPAQFGNTVMGSYSYLGQENLDALGAFLATSDGPR